MILRFWRVSTVFGDNFPRFFLFVLLRFWTASLAENFEYTEHALHIIQTYSDGECLRS